MYTYAVIYDGECVVCSRLAGRLVTMDKRQQFETVSSQDARVAERFPWIAPREFAESLQLVRLSDGRTWAGASAIEEILAHLRVGPLVSWIFASRVGRRVADLVYRWFADHRRAFGCGDVCASQVPATGR